MRIDLCRARAYNEKKPVKRKEAHPCKTKSLYPPAARSPGALRPAPADGCIWAIWRAACWHGSAQKVRAGASCCASRIWMPSAAPASTPTCWSRTLRGWGLHGTRAAAPAAHTRPITRANAGTSIPKATASWSRRGWCTLASAPAPSCTPPAHPTPRTATSSTRAPAGG